MSAAVDTRVRLVPTGRGAMVRGGTVSHEVHVDGRWIGWVGDAREWKGHRHGGRTWWACHRETGDTGARWNSGPMPTRAVAIDALVARATA